MGLLCKYVENEGTGSGSAEKNFPPSYCGLPSTSAAGLQMGVVDFLDLPGCRGLCGQVVQMAAGTANFPYNKINSVLHRYILVCH